MAGAIDTLKIYERLKGASLDDRAAKEIAEVIKDVTESNLVTVDAMEKALAKQTAEVIKWVAAMLVAQAGVIAAMLRFLGLTGR